MRSLIAALLLCLSLPAAAEQCTASIYTTHDPDQNGTRTASGIPLNDRLPTIAHKTLPLRSVVRVTNLQNGRTEALRVTDRGPYIKGRCVDLSLAASILLGCKGLCPVRVQ